MSDDSPFGISPNPNCLHINPTLKAVVHKARFAINKRQGITAILGDFGLGKSSLVRYLWNEYAAREDINCTLLLTPLFTSDFMMLKSICSDFEIPARASIASQQAAFNGFLIESYKAGKNCIIFIDEAQKLNNKMLELLRAILNFENDKHKLCQIVLSGQLELRDRLLQKQNKPLYSRLVAPSVLSPLTLDDTHSMIKKRCEYFEIQNPFTKDAIDRLYELTIGVPRDALNVCNVAYEMMELAGLEQIDREFLEMAHEESLLRPETKSEEIARVAANG